MKRIKELLSIRKDDNRIEIDAEIYNILDSQTEVIWKQLNKSGKITEKCVLALELYL